jgi:hypothetical protein
MKMPQRCGGVAYNVPMKYSLRSLMRFSIRDMFLITVVAAVAVWSVNREREYRAMQKEVFRLRRLYYGFPADPPNSLAPANISSKKQSATNADP